LKFIAHPTLFLICNQEVKETTDFQSGKLLINPFFVSYQIANLFIPLTFGLQIRMSLLGSAEKSLNI